MSLPPALEEPLGVGCRLLLAALGIEEGERRRLLEPGEERDGLLEEEAGPEKGHGDAHLGEVHGGVTPGALLGAGLAFRLARAALLQVVSAGLLCSLLLFVLAGGVGTASEVWELSRSVPLRGLP